MWTLTIIAFFAFSSSSSADFSQELEEPESIEFLIKSREKRQDTSGLKKKSFNNNFLA